MARNGHGGARPGAGRPSGAATVKTRAVADALAVSGETPLEVMTSAMRLYWRRSEAEGHEGDNLAKAVACAEKAAAFIHPRLAAVSQENRDAEKDGPPFFRMFAPGMKPPPAG